MIKILQSKANSSRRNFRVQTPNIHVFNDTQRSSSSVWQSKQRNKTLNLEGVAKLLMSRNSYITPRYSTPRDKALSCQSSVVRLRHYIDMKTRDTEHICQHHLAPFWSRELSNSATFNFMNIASPGNKNLQTVQYGHSAGQVCWQEMLATCC
jgi:hypothetical protein